ncbi:Multidrug resistance protein MdtA precursor [Rubripirellula amarantea]|uniref:Multidrug resistance protein MdtA n=1 Tax=Rubripirellula amarantea TaxID=2527999 RepID=A0A5C5WYD4_9BACT|nr:efflux RND transporter periplasmic adaptor subunit [Rubripirellula amarantea]TWT54915.1 Multidrug resistance protein MdtA precursor [Rubripirellula amarantea]
MKLLAQAIVRLIIPLAILAGGGYGYTLLSVEVDDGKSRPTKEEAVRSRVQSLHVSDYDVKIETHGVVGPHNRVTLSAEVTGTIRSTERAFEVGSYFKSGELLLQMDSLDYQTALIVAREQHQLAKATLKLAETAHERMKSLSNRNSASDSERDSTFAALVQAQSQVEIAAAAVDQANRDLQRTKIYAPFDGRVASKLIGVGQLVSSGTVLGEVFAIDYAEVRLPIANRELRHLKLPEMEGDPTVSVELRDAIDSDSEAVWDAKIVRTEGALDPDSLELFAIARIDDPFALKSDHRILRIGQPVVAKIQGETLHDVVAIPRGAVRRLDMIYLIDGKERTLRSLSVDPLWTDSDNVVVPGGLLREGELLATTTLVYAPEGSVVEIIPDVDSGNAFAGEPAELEPTP